MYKEKRTEQIFQTIQENGDASVEELAQKFHVSTMTIRRDLAFLEKSGVINRTHGGAICISSLPLEELYETKQTQNYAVKQQIAQKTVDLIKTLPCINSIFLDAGTTTYQIALLIKQQFQDLTIFTNDLKIASELFDSSHTVFICGGRIQRETGCVVGQQSDAFVKSLNIDLCVLGVQSINSRLFLSASLEEKAINKQKILASSSTKILTCDKSKFNSNGIFTIASVTDFNYVITDYCFPEEHLSQLERSGTSVIPIV